MQSLLSERRTTVKNKLLLGLLLTALVIVPAAYAQTTVRCETGECIFTGDSTVSLSHQLSHDNCIEGKTWGVRGNRIWVSGGCRADFVITPNNATSVAVNTTTLVCESGWRRHDCPADTHYGVQLTRQISSRSCIEGKTWGYDSNGIWVEHGCRAEFVLNGPAYSASSVNSQILVCESVNNTKHWCSTNTRLGVNLSRQLSDNKCVLGDSWGYDKNGIWVSKGCRAEFSVGR
jgi:hypothetical protein